jgi:hypothetical protein
MTCIICGINALDNVKRLWCWVFGHSFRFAEFDPVSCCHAIRCDRCGVYGWPGSGLLTLWCSEDHPAQTPNL